MSASHRRPVPLNKAYRLLNHGPTVLVSAAYDGQRNIMAAAWAMPLDFEPPKVAVVLDKSTWTRQLLEASGTFVLNVPCVDQADIVQTVGNTSGLTSPKPKGKTSFRLTACKPLPANKSKRRCSTAASPGLNAVCSQSRAITSNTTCFSPKSSLPTPMSACSATDAGISKGTMVYAPCTTWRAGIF